MKRLLIIFGILLALIALGIVVFFLFFRGDGGAGPDGEPANPFDGIGAGLGEPRTIEIPEVGVPVAGAGEEVGPRLYKITDGPVAHGAVAFSTTLTPSGTTTPITDTEIRYIDRASGNMYRFLLRERTLERITNLTLPGIQEAVWASDGSRAFLRFFSTELGVGRLETYALSGEGGEGYFLEANLSDVVVNGTSSILSVLTSSNGSIGTRATLSGASATTVFSSPLSTIKTHRSGTAYAVHTKPSAFVPGHAFSISQTGQFTRILGPLSALSLLPGPSGTEYLYSFKDGNSLRLAHLDTATYETVALPVATMAEKCVWTSDGRTAYCAVPRSMPDAFPDDWYLGVEQTNDRVWKIDLEERVATLLFDPFVLTNEETDIVALTLDSANEVLVFTNRDDGSLWVYDL